MTNDLTVILVLLGTICIKAAHKMLMILTPAVILGYFLIFKFVVSRADYVGGVQVVHEMQVFDP